MSTGCQKTLCPYVNMSVCQYVRMQHFSLGIKMKVVQNVIRMSDSQYVNTSIRQYVNTSIRQYVNMSECNFSAQVSKRKLFRISDRQHVNTRQHVNFSICQYVRMQLFSLGIKMKVVQNVIMMSDSQKLSSQKLSKDS